MTLTTKTLWTTMAAVVIGAAAVVSVAAQPPGQGFGRGHRGFGPGGPGPMAMLRQLDLTDAQRTQIRAIMDDECPALDFYRGFYLQPDDQRICAKRESIQNRVGGSCRIERFKRLVPQLKQVKR